MSIFNIVKFITTHPLNKDQKASTLLRFIKWQIGSRLVPGAVAYNWIQNSKFLVSNGEAGLTGNIYAGLLEFEDMGFLLHILEADDLFVDVGANAGSYTILASSVRGAKVYAFEPVPNTYNRLIENISINHAENRVKCFNVGLGREEGIIAFTSDLDTVNHAVSLNEYAPNTINVNVTTLDLGLKDTQPSLIKIDVEGYETLVLEGATETLAKPTLLAVIIELNGCGNRYGFDESQIREIMSKHGFRTYSYDPFTRKLIDLQGKTRHEGNTLFIRNIDLVQERLKRTPRVSVHGKSL